MQIASLLSDKIVELRCILFHEIDTRIIKLLQQEKILLGHVEALNSRKKNYYLLIDAL